MISIRRGIRNHNVIFSLFGAFEEVARAIRDPALPHRVRRQPKLGFVHFGS